MRTLPAIVPMTALAAVLAACASPSPPAPVQPAPPAAAASPGAPPVEERRKALAALLAEHWEWSLRSDPDWATVLGDRRYNDRWTDQSAAGINGRIEDQKSFLARFEALDPAGLPGDEALSLQLMIRNLREEVEAARFEGWLMPIEQVGGVHLELPQLVAILPFASVKDYQDYLTRLRAVPRVFDDARELLRAGLEKKLVPPRAQLERALAQVEALARNRPEASPFAQPVQKFADTIPVGEQTRLRAEVTTAIRDHVLPAYARLAVFLRDEYVPRGRADAGIWSLPDGAARYAFAVKRFTTTAMTPDEIHTIGLREVERIESEQAAIGAALGFRDLAAFRRHIRASRKLYAASRQDILDRYQRFTDRMYAELPRLFGRLPQRAMVILPIEEYREKAFPAAQYIRGAEDGSRIGAVRVNTGDAAKRSTVDIEAIAYHEGVPGHHLQIALHQEMRDLPPFRRHGYVGAYIEGWGLYSERLGKEVGLYGDPYSDYGRLQLEMARAIRLVADTGIHHKRWTRDQVVTFFRDHSTLDEPTVQNETDRYIVWPGQALTYKVGQLTISRLREKARGALGAAFDVRDFHDEILGAGALPLDVLEERIDAWIARAGRPAVPARQG